MAVPSWTSWLILVLVGAIAFLTLLKVAYHALTSPSTPDRHGSRQNQRKRTTNGETEDDPRDSVSAEAISSSSTADSSTTDYASDSPSVDSTKADSPAEAKPETVTVRKVDEEPVGEGTPSSQRVGSSPSTAGQLSKRGFGDLKGVQRQTSIGQVAGRDPYARRRLRRTRLTRTARKPRRQQEGEEDSSFINLIDSNRENRLFGVDDTWGVVDYDTGLTGFRVNLVPDLIELTFWPSPTYQPVGSPVEINIWSLLRRVLLPPAETQTPESEAAAGSTREVGRFQGPQQSSLHSPQDRRHVPVDASQPLPHTPEAHQVDQVPPSDTMADFTPRNEVGASHQPRSSHEKRDDRILSTEISDVERGWEIEEDSITADTFSYSASDCLGDRDDLGIDDPLAVDEPATQPVQEENGSVGYQSGWGQKYSPPRVELLQVETPSLPEFGDFGTMLRDQDTSFVDVGESVSERPTDTGFDFENWKNPSEDPVVEPDLDSSMGEDLFGVNWFEESVKEARNSFGVLDDADPNPLFPEWDGDSFDEPDDWLTF